MLAILIHGLPMKCALGKDGMRFVVQMEINEDDTTWSSTVISHVAIGIHKFEIYS